MSEYTFVVTFVGDYFVLGTRVVSETMNPNTAVQMAADLIESQYGWDLLATGTVSAEAELV